MTPIAPLADNWLEHENAIANALSRRVKLGEVAGYMNISKSPTLSNIINAATVKKG